MHASSWLAGKKVCGFGLQDLLIVMPIKRFSLAQSFCTEAEESGNKMASLAKNLAALLVEESSSDMNQNGRRNPNKDIPNRLELKRFLEHRVKKRVKAQFMISDGKFHDLLDKVIANPSTLRDAYDSIRVNSNIFDMGELKGKCDNRDNISFVSLAQELACGNFDVNANTYTLSTRGADKQVLVLPNLRLSVVQEAIRIALEVVYKPHYSKISHGCRSGRGHSSAFKYIRKEISDANWCFTLAINKQVDDCVIDKLVLTMEEKIEDPGLYAIIRSMFQARVLNLEFGGFVKGHGLPQEGLLSPVLMNIYLDLFDREILRMSIKYEVFDTENNLGKYDESSSKLRGWFRRQMNNTSDAGNNSVGNVSGVRVHCCRFMDEILIVLSGSNEVAVAFRSEIQRYLRDSLHLNFYNQTEILQYDDSRGVRFLGTLVRRTVKESPAVRAVHKLKEKVELFALQKREAWDEGTLRIGKKWLAHGLKKVKESEIRHLAQDGSVLSQIAHFRRPGMETDHWYKALLKIWMQDTNAKLAESEDSILSKSIGEPALPQDLRDSFYRFQKCAEEYVSSETNSTLALLPESLYKSSPVSITEINAPVAAIKKRLFRYGVTNSQGNARTSHMLILQDHDQIIDWFSGIVYRWLRWYRYCDNLNEVKIIISDQVRKSCIRTLAAKYRIHESEIEKKFDLDLSRIPSTLEIENDMTSEMMMTEDYSYDEGLLYGIPYSGLCLLSLTRIVSQSRPCNCFVMGCMAAAPCVYTIHVMERQKFAGWETGFPICIHPCIHRRRVGLCKQHLKDLYLGHISLQSINFDAWK